MSAHTPGPWEVGPNGERSKQHIYAKNGPLLVTHLWDGCSEADARLIAAAPDMLVCLQHVLRWHDQLSTDDINRVRAVVAQALEKQAEVTRHD